MRKIALVICAVALVVAGTASTSSRAASADTPHLHKHQVGPRKYRSRVWLSRRDHHREAYRTCCLGDCMATLGLPPRAAISPTPFSMTLVAYWDARVTLSSHLIAPALGPPI